MKGLYAVTHGYAGSPEFACRQAFNLCATAPSFRPPLLLPKMQPAKIGEARPCQTQACSSVRLRTDQTNKAVQAQRPTSIGINAMNGSMKGLMSGPATWIVPSLHFMTDCIAAVVKAGAWGSICPLRAPETVVTSSPVVGKP
jgi:hypothetical protein